MHILCFTGVIAVIEANDSSSSSASNFNVQSFIHSNKLPGVVSINSAYELSDVFIDAKLSQFGSEGNFCASHFNVFKLHVLNVHTYVPLHIRSTYLK